MTALEAMLRQCQAEGAPGPYSCAATVAASMPDGSALASAYAAFAALPAHARRRALIRPEVAARFVAIKAHCPPALDGDAWGVVHGGAGRVCFARRIGGRWYARSEWGVARVPDGAVIKAWGIA